MRRLDALNRIGNQGFSIDLKNPENYAGSSAPVHYPRIWNTPWFDWVQYNGSIMQPMVRNAGESLGVSAELNLTEPSKGLYKSSVNIKALELQIATDVTNAALTVQSSLETVQASAVARELSQKRLEAAQSKFEVGMATNYEVVQAQRDFVDARNNELRAILSYRRALVNFETAQVVGSLEAGLAQALDELPARIDGGYYIRYVGTFPWSHFEAR